MTEHYFLTRRDGSFYVSEDDRTVFTFDEANTLMAADNTLAITPAFTY